jgi:GST-like protein
LYGVMDGQLAWHEFIAGGDYSIADIAIWPWVAQHDWSGVELTPFSHLARWFAQVGARPAVQRGMEVPAGTRTPEKVIAAAQSMLMK